MTPDRACGDLAVPGVRACGSGGTGREVAKPADVRERALVGRCRVCGSGHWLGGAAFGQRAVGCKRRMRQTPGTPVGAPGDPLCYLDSKARSLANSSPDAVSNIFRSWATVSFFFSSPEMSRMILPLYIMMRRLP